MKSRKAPANTGTSRKPGHSKKDESAFMPSKNSPWEITETEGIFYLMRSTSAGRFLLCIAGIALLIGINLLLSLNVFERFFLFLGIEIMTAVLIIWALHLIKNRKAQDS